jgi:hypothetical protein
VQGRSEGVRQRGRGSRAAATLWSCGGGGSISRRSNLCLPSLFLGWSRRHLSQCCLRPQGTRQSDLHLSCLAVETCLACYSPLAVEGSICHSYPVPEQRAADSGCAACSISALASTLLVTILLCYVPIQYQQACPVAPLACPVESFIVGASTLDQGFPRWHSTAPFDSFNVDLFMEPRSASGVGHMANLQMTQCHKNIASTAGTRCRNTVSSYHSTMEPQFHQHRCTSINLAFPLRECTSCSP